MARFRSILFFTVGLVLLLFSGCIESEVAKPSARGKNTEVLVCTNYSSLQNLSSSILNLFEKEQPYFIFGNEPYFNAIKVKLEGLDGTLLQYRTIVILAHDKNKALIKEKFDINVDELSLKMKDKHMTTLKDLWANGQHVIFIYGQTENELRKYMKDNEDKILQYTLDVQSKDLGYMYTKNMAGNDNFTKIKETFGRGIRIPSSFKLVVNKPNTMCFIEDTDNYTSTIMVHSYPYQDTSQFNEEYIVAKRDSLGKKYIQGEQAGTYMSTASKDKYFRFAKTKYYNEVYVKELRGKWTVKGEFKAGPFINYSILDEKNQQIIMVEGFLMYPDTDKRKTPFLRTFEALPWTFE